MLVLPIVALVGTNNLSTAIIILGIAVILAFVSRPGYAQFLWIGLAGTGVVTIFLMMEQYRLERLVIWKNPEALKKDFRRYRDYMPSAPEGCLESDSEMEFRSWGLYQKHRMI